MSQIDPEHLGLRYWTWKELQAFVVQHDLVICAGLDTDDTMALSPKGQELALFFIAALNAGAGLRR